MQYIQHLIAEILIFKCKPIVSLVLAFTAMHLAQMMTLRSQNKTNDMHQNNSDRVIPYLRQSI